MRVFKASCTDNKTGYEMILSECSYNMACEWLSRELTKEDMEILNVEVDFNGIYHIFTGITLSPTLQWSGRTFYYDEERGVLLGE